MESEIQASHLREFKVSAYNLIERDHDGTFLLANTFTCAILRLPISTDPHIIDTLVSSHKPLQLVHDDPVTTLLLENGFVVPPTRNELEILRQRWERSRVGAKALALAIVPTLSCNFRCNYCYESHTAIDMSTLVQDGVLQYLEKNLPGRELLKIVWFGGEPLLRPRLLERLSKRFIQLSQANDLAYDASAVTNGYLLSEEMVGFLASILVTRLQITLDGPQVDHDKRRFLANGRPTYRRILQNLLSCAEQFSEIILRVNIDTRNRQNLEELLADLAPIKEQIVLAFRPTHPPDGDANGERWCITPSDWWPLQRSLARSASEQGFSIAHGYPLPGTAFCSAYQLNSTIVDPYGDIHTCPVFIGKRQSRLGTLRADGEVLFSDGLQRVWAASSPFDDESCGACKALPICMGGCPYHSGKGRSSLRCFARADIATGLFSDFFMNRSRSASVPVGRRTESGSLKGSQLGTEDRGSRRRL